MISRRQFVRTLSAGAVAAPFIGRGAEKPALHLGLVADPQYVDAPPLGSRCYRESIGKLTTAIDHFNTLDLDFCINVGDSIDRDWESYDAILKVFAKSRQKFQHLLGNHDFELPENLKLKAPARLGMEGRYYAVSKGGFCLAMLDTNDLSVYAYPQTSAEMSASMDEFKRYAATGAINAVPWNGAVGPAQMKWLDETCQTAAAAKQKVILFAHHPILPTGINHNEWNAEALVKFVESHRNVVAWINGHNHAGGYELHGGVPYITMHGMVETKATNAFATARLFADRLELTGHGREPSREIPFRTG